MSRLGIADQMPRLDCTDMVEYNMKLLNPNSLTESFFCLSKSDPTFGFAFDATTIFGPTYPGATDQAVEASDDLHSRLRLGSHLARHLRHELESQKGYTATVGIATNKLLSKLVGNVNKPKNQTTLVPPFEPLGSLASSVTSFMDGHDIGKVPGVGFKLAQKIRSSILGRSAQVQEGLVVGFTKEPISVGDARGHANIDPEKLELLLGGPGSPKGIGWKVWELLHGIDDSEVAKAKRVPSQISQEDSYMKYLHTLEQVKHQLRLLSERLIRRMHIDLMEDNDEELGDDQQRRWLAHPRTLRLTTRPRLPANDEGVRPRTFQRISRSAPVPNFIFGRDSPAAIADRLTDGILSGSGWNLSLMNIAVTNMAEAASETGGGQGRDISVMFRRQDDVLKDFRVYDDEPPSDPATKRDESAESVDDFDMSDPGQDGEDGHPDDVLEVCADCKMMLPTFAMMAHRQYHQADAQYVHDARIDG
jgi:DNA polymerase iota